MVHNVGKRIRDLRKNSGITQLELAQHVNSSGQVISNIEREYSKPTPELLARIASYFNVPADYLFGQSNSRWLSEYPYSQSNIFSKRVSKLMSQLQMDETALATAINIDVELVKSIIDGTTKPAVDTMSHIATALNTTIDYLIGSSNYAIAVSNEDEEDVLRYFRGMDKSHRRRFMGLLEEMMNE